MPVLSYLTPSGHTILPPEATITLTPTRILVPLTQAQLAALVEQDDGATPQGELREAFDDLWEAMEAIDEHEGFA